MISLMDNLELLSQLNSAFEDYNQVATKQHQDTYRVHLRNGAVIVSADRSQKVWEIPGDLLTLMNRIKNNAQINECTIGTLADLENIERELRTAKY
ncbi:hypothetical protein FD47_GL001220 [Lentilactobacillus parafarraginis DSM 18390 = JCM 14109]|uniref:Uncharacterized protein n=2 Tax=Lentilactobacillus parafarraginis TaxID=390842 RepID=A0A0R1YPP7_9LACO|nr:hypothetical protein FD47_GL001220 [Lentilactobacillus parafarraginis DSM 18390 = JCM 14109]